MSRLSFTLTARLQNRVITQLSQDPELYLRSGEPGDLYEPMRRVTPELFAERLGVPLRRVMEAVADEFDLPFMDLEIPLIDPQAVEKVDGLYAVSQRVMPVFLVGEEMTVALGNPFQKPEVMLLGSRIGCSILPVLAMESKIEDALLHFFDEAAPEEEAPPEDENTLSPAELRRQIENGVEPDLVSMVDSVIAEAVEQGASDLHFEAREEGTVVRYRIDGVLYPQITIPVTLSRGVTSRIKIISSLDIAERQRTQDGRYSTKVGDKEVEFRVSVLPTHLGEKIVMRVLDRSSVQVKLEQLGLSPEDMALFERMIAAPNGVILITGPTGSGKSTTLYSALNRINSEEINILTVEDPVEFHLPIINQVQVNPTKDLTFARALRSALRQDPDVIMVGEMRDKETAEIAMRAALTGHLVFSTLHTNDAPSAVTRLLDMGVDPTVVAVAIRGVMAQRLARKVCSGCKEAYHPSEGELRSLGLGDLAGQEIRFFRGAGCPICQGRGTKGRMGIFEMIGIDEELKTLIQDAAPLPRIRAFLNKRGFRPMRFDGALKVLAGHIPASEVIRLTGEEEA